MAYRSSEKQTTQPPSYNNKKGRPYSVTEEALIVPTVNGDVNCGDIRKTYRRRHDELVDHGRVALAAAASFGGETDVLEWPPCKIIKELENMELVRTKSSQSGRRQYSHRDFCSFFFSKEKEREREKERLALSP